MSELFLANHPNRNWKALLFAVVPFLTILVIELKTWLSSADSLSIGAFAVLLISLFAAVRIYRLENQNKYKEISIKAIDGLAGVIIFDKSLKTKYVNRQFTRITGYAENQVKDLTFSSLPFIQNTTLIRAVRAQLQVSNYWSGEFSAIGQFGEPFSVMLHVRKLLNKFGETHRIIVTFTDISSLKRTEKKLITMAEKDPLTNSWNRRRFNSALSELTSKVRKNNSFNACLAVIDIDHFKEINDLHGHDEGDRVLIEVANTLAENSRDSDIVARIGGEEFAVLMPRADITNAIEAAHRLKASIQNNDNIDVTVSCGVSPVLEKDEETYRAADQALYHAKRAGRNLVMGSPAPCQAISS